MRIGNLTKLSFSGLLMVTSLLVILNLGAMNVEAATATYTLADSYSMNAGSGETVADGSSGGGGYYDGYFPSGSSYDPAWFNDGTRIGLEFAGGSQWSQSDHVEFTQAHWNMAWITDGFKLCASVKIDSNSGYYTIFDNYYYDDATGYAYGYTLYIVNGEARFSIYCGANGNYDTATSSGHKMNTTGYVYVEAYYNNYNIDKIQVGWQDSTHWHWSTVANAPYPPSSHDNTLTAIGQREDGNGGYMPFDGRIDYFMVYDTDWSG